MKTSALVVFVYIACCGFVFSAEQPGSLPPPVSDKVYTFQDIEKEKATLKDKVVKIEIQLIGKGSGAQADGTVRYFAKDTSGGAAPYGQVVMPREGLEKLGADQNADKAFTCYARVHVFPEKKAAAMCLLLGTKISNENGKTSYSW